MFNVICWLFDALFSKLPVIEKHWLYNKIKLTEIWDPGVIIVIYGAPLTLKGSTYFVILDTCGVSKFGNGGTLV